MAMYVAAIVALLALLRPAAATAPVGTLVCSEDGFTVSFASAYDAAKTQVWEVSIGTGTGSTFTAGAGSCVVAEVAVADAVALATSPAEIAYKSGATVACGGTLQRDDDDAANIDANIEYDADIQLILTETWRSNNIRRSDIYEYTMKCSLTRDVTESSGRNWVIDQDIAPVAGTGVSEALTFPISIKFYDQTARNNELTDGASVTLGDTLFIRISEDNDNSLFQFRVDDCWFNGASDSSSTTTKDDWLVDECPVDTDTSLVSFTDKAASDANYDIQVKAFFFAADSSATIYLHCDLTICLQDASDCDQDTAVDCGMTKRRRRRSTGTGIEHRTITSQQHIVLGQDEGLAPHCGHDLVWDRAAATCSDENLVDIHGLYLDIPWNEEYMNTSSTAFKNFASLTSYRLWVVTQMTTAGRDHITGLEVMSAENRGAVVLTVRIKHLPTLGASAAFEIFEHAVRKSYDYRVANVLNIVQEKVIEYVPVTKPSSDFDKMTLIIVTVLVCVVVFSAVSVTVWKIRHGRYAGEAPHVAGKENPTFNNVA